MRIRLFILLLSLLAGCAKLEESKPVAENPEKAPDQVIWNGEIEVIRDGLVQSVVHAGRILAYQKDQRTYLDSGVVVDFFDKRGQHKSTLTSRQARIEEGKDIFQALGDVIVRSDSGDVLRTERLYWDKGRQKIRSDTLVVMTTRSDSLRGFDFESNEDLTSWTLQQPSGQTFRRVTK